MFDVVPMINAHQVTEANVRCVWRSTEHMQLACYGYWPVLYLLRTSAWITVYCDEHFNIVFFKGPRLCTHSEIRNFVLVFRRQCVAGVILHLNYLVNSAGVGSHSIVVKMRVYRAWIRLRGTANRNVCRSRATNTNTNNLLLGLCFFYRDPKYLNMVL